MTEIELYNFIIANDIEWREQDNDGTPDIIIFPYIYQIKEFANLLKGYTYDEGIECRLLNDGYIIWSLLEEEI